MTALASERRFLDALKPILKELSKKTQRPPLSARVVSGLKLSLSGDELQVPRRYVEHWERFGVLPFELVHHAALLMIERVQPRLDEADRVTFAEEFARDALLTAD